MVLIIDDCQLIREKVKELVSISPLTQIVGEAENVKDGIDQLNKLNPDVILLDIHLNKESGMDILIHAKKNKPKIWIVILSNSADLFYRRKFKEAGCDYFLDKSKEFLKISEIINELTSLK